MLPFRIQGTVKNYEWGRQDKDCLVWRYSGLQEFKEGKYAEVWLGTHPSGPSTDQSGKTLPQIFAERGQIDIGFLFKVLSVDKCLSIQVHPNKSQAQLLHSKDPKNYPDANDKPELFLTLTPFKVLMGFISAQQYGKLKQLQPFSCLQSHTVKDATKQIMSMSKEQTDQMVTSIVAHKGNFKQRTSLVDKMFKQFGLDVGIIVSFLLGYKQLPPGKAFYINAGQPHAYVQGQILQLMKNSDNVVRLGLTPKYKDVGTLLQILDYDNTQILPLDKQQLCYRGGILRLYQIESDQTLELPQRSIALVSQGSFTVNGVKFQQKHTALVPSGKMVITGKGKLYLASAQ